MFTVDKCGRLFEYFIYTCGGYATKRRLVTALTAHGQPEARLPTDVQESLVDECGVRFLGWLLMHMASIGAKGRKQMFYLTFLLHYFGISREGISHMHDYGFGISLTTFDNMKADSVIKSSVKLRSNYILYLYKYRMLSHSIFI
jgi:hypothetical protein